MHVRVDDTERIYDTRAYYTSVNRRARLYCAKSWANKIEAAYTIYSFSSITQRRYTNSVIRWVCSVQQRNGPRATLFGFILYI